MVKVTEKIDTHTVIKKEDILKYLEEPEQAAFEEILDKIVHGRADDGKTPVNHYYIVNKNEPYAEAVHKIILGGEAVKEESVN